MHPDDDPEAMVAATSRALAHWYGINIPHYQRGVLRAELERLGRSSGIKPVVDRLLARDAASWSVILDAITVPETYFFRNFGHFALLRDHARALDAAGRSCRVLSAGCSSGEEVWSIAAVLSDLEERGARRGEVVGWDVSPRRIELATARRYRDWSMRGGLHGYERFFVRSGDSWDVSAALARMVRFELVNLVHDFPNPDRPFDVVFFRNVAIYWDIEVGIDVSSRLARLVADDGLFLVGPSDPASFDDQGWTHTIADSVRCYRRVPTARISKRPSMIPSQRPIERVKAARAAEAAHAPTARRRRAPAAARVSRAEAAREPPTSWLDQVRALADAGAYREALDAVRTSSADSTERRFWEGVLLVNLARADDAIVPLRECVYLEPENATYRRWLAVAYDAAGMGADAERERRNARELEVA